jgi:hypothetical protein
MPIQCTRAAMDYAPPYPVQHRDVTYNHMIGMDKCITLRSRFEVEARALGVRWPVWLGDGVWMDG